MSFNLSKRRIHSGRNDENIDPQLIEVAQSNVDINKFSKTKYEYPLPLSPNDTNKFGSKKKHRKSGLQMNSFLLPISALKQNTENEDLELLVSPPEIVLTDKKKRRKSLSNTTNDHNNNKSLSDVESFNKNSSSSSSSSPSSNENELFMKDFDAHYSDNKLSHNMIMVPLKFLKGRSTAHVRKLISFKNNIN